MDLWEFIAATVRNIQTALQDIERETGVVYDMAFSDRGGSVSFDVLVGTSTEKSGGLKAKGGIPVLNGSVDGKLAEGKEDSPWKILLQIFIARVIWISIAIVLKTLILIDRLNISIR